MKRFAIVFLVLTLFSIAAYAEMGQMDHSQMQQGDQQMKMECPKMKMMQQGDQEMKMMHCQDTMQMMMNIVDMQEKLLMGVKPEEKEKMLQDIKQMKEKMQGMMSSCKCMMGGMMGQPAPAAPAPESTGGKEPVMTAPHH